jgi:hypothetical protein
VFNFAVASPGVTTTSIFYNDVLSCKSVLSIEDKDNDLALVTLDRRATGQSAVTLANRDMNNPLPIGSPLVLIGHPIAVCQ